MGYSDEEQELPKVSAAARPPEKRKEPEHVPLLPIPGQPWEPAEEEEERAHEPIKKTNSKLSFLGPSFGSSSSSSGPSLTY